MNHKIEELQTQMTENERRIDHRSYERQGLDKLPTQHEGPAVNEMEKRGIRTNKRALNNWIRKTWKLITELKDMITALLEAVADLQAEIRAEKKEEEMICPFLCFFVSCFIFSYPGSSASP